jgi:hypothetical protein
LWVAEERIGTLLTSHLCRWAGVPVVTLAGEGMQARAGASIALAAGHAETIARTPEDYVAIARRLLLARAGAQDRATSAQDHGAARADADWPGQRDSKGGGRRFGARGTAALFDVRQWVGNLERMLRSLIDASMHAPSGECTEYHHVASAAQTRRGPG